MRYDFFYNYITSLERQKALKKLNKTLKSTDDEGTKTEYDMKKIDNYQISAVDEEIQATVNFV